jgi:hypothetical protein
MLQDTTQSLAKPAQAACSGRIFVIMARMAHQLSPHLLACLLGLCRVVFEQCCSCWERLNTRAMALLPSATGQGTAEGRKKKKKQELQLDSQGQPDWDEEQVSPATLTLSCTLCLAISFHNWVPNKGLLQHICFWCAQGHMPVLIAHTPAQQSIVAEAPGSAGCCVAPTRAANTSASPVPNGTSALCAYLGSAICQNASFLLECCGVPHTCR